MFNGFFFCDFKVSANKGESREQKVLDIAQNIGRQLPENIDYEGTKKILSTDPSPLNVVLLQEIQRYNSLLDLIRQQLTDLEKGIQGLVVMSSELEEIFGAIYDGRVPNMWGKVFDLTCDMNNADAYRTCANKALFFCFNLDCRLMHH